MALHTASVDREILPHEFRAVWVATVANIDWPSTPGLPSEVMKNELNALFDKVQDLNMNAVILQVRPSADALYASKYEPWSYFLTGQQGKAPEGGYDPLKDAVVEAHKRGLELHVWINPYRALHPKQEGPIASDHFSKLHPEATVKYGSYLWMDPGDVNVQNQTYKVCMDLVKRYDIDGLHIDDYFYPYPEGGQAFPDQRTYTKYLQEGGHMALDDWRRDNVNKFIHRVYDGVKETKKWVKFGISPFGIWQPGYPAQIRGLNQYDQLYADAKKWLNEGWCDYLSPQLYWPIDREQQSFPVLLDWWRSENTQNRHIWPGQYTSKLNPSDGNWPASEIVNQIDLVRRGPGTHGTAQFSMEALRNDYQGIDEALKSGPYKDKALIPESPWLSTDRPGKPRVVSSDKETVSGSQAWVLKVKASSDSKVRFYAVSADSKLLFVSNSPGFSWKIDASVPPQVDVAAIDVYGNIGPTLTVPRPD